MISILGNNKHRYHSGVFADTADLAGLAAVAERNGVRLVAVQRLRANAVVVRARVGGDADGLQGRVCEGRKLLNAGNGSLFFWY